MPPSGKNPNFDRHCFDQRLKMDPMNKVVPSRNAPSALLLRKYWRTYWIPSTTVSDFMVAMYFWNLRVTPLDPISEWRSSCAQKIDQGYKSKTSLCIANEFDPVCVSRLCDHRVGASDGIFEARWMWGVEGLSGNNSVKLGTDESRSLLSCRPSRPGVRNMCELKLHLLIYTFLTRHSRTDAFDSLTK